MRRVILNKDVDELKEIIYDFFLFKFERTSEILETALPGVYGIVPVDPEIEPVFIGRGFAAIGETFEEAVTSLQLTNPKRESTMFEVYEFNNYWIAYD